MSILRALRDPLCLTVAVASAAVLCLAAFLPTAPQAAKSAATPQAVVAAAPAAAVRLEAPAPRAESDPTDLALVGMSIANYDR